MKTPLTKIIGPNITDDEVEYVARAACFHLNLDPEAHVSHGFGADMTPLEYARWAKDAVGIPAIGLASPRWRTMRAQAAAAIAFHRAVTGMPDIAGAASPQEDKPT